MRQMTNKQVRYAMMLDHFGLHRSAGNVLKPSRRRLTNKQKVLRKYPLARCIQVSGCTVAVFKRGILSNQDLLAMAHTPHAAWADAAKRLTKGKR